MLPSHWQSFDWAGRQAECNFDMRDKEGGEILHHITFGPSAGESTPVGHPENSGVSDSETPNQTFDFAIFVSIRQRLTQAYFFTIFC